MEKIRPQHSVLSLIYAGSRAMERAAYYGVRSLLVLYMLSKTLKMEEEQAFQAYGLFTGSIIFAQIFGGIVGDLLTGNKNALIIGAILQAAGCFLFCIPNIHGLFIGLIFIAYGAGLYSPNILAHFGKLYLQKLKLLDGAYSIFYLAVNIGAFFGVIIVGLMGDKSFNLGFITAGFMFLVSVIPLLAFREKTEDLTIKHKLSVGERSINIFSIAIMIGVFWTAYELFAMWINEIDREFIQNSKLNFTKNIWYSVSSFSMLFVGLAAGLIWSFFYYNRWVKLITGFFTAALAIGLLLFLPESPSDNHLPLYIASIILLSIAELHVGAVVYSMITKYSNPKYLAIVISISFLPMKLFLYVVSLYSGKFSEEPISSVQMSVLILTLTGLEIILFLGLKKYSSKRNFIVSEN